MKSAMRFSARLSSAAAALLLSCAAAGATTAITLSPLNVRSGPGTNYQTLITIPQGATVDVLACTPTWCSINGPGPSFVAAAFLGFSGRVPYVRGGPMLIAPVPGRPMPSPGWMPPPANGGFVGVPPGPGGGPFFGVGAWSW